MSTDSHAALISELADERQRSARLTKASLRLTERVRQILPSIGMGLLVSLESGRKIEAAVAEVERAALAGGDGAGESEPDDEQYTLLRDALDAHLGQFFHDDDAAEVAIYIEGVERLGCALAAVKLGDEGYEGPVEWGRYQTKERQP